MTVRHREQWIDCYMHPVADIEKVDVHQKFADAIGVDRLDAKLIHHQNMNAIPCIRNSIRDMVNAEEAYFGLKDEMLELVNSHGIEGW